MKILTIGDTHFKPDNVIESYDFINKLEQYIIKNNNNIEYIVVLGDILHTHEKIFTLALNVALDFFKMLVKYKENKIFVLVGNHDMTSNTNFLNDSHWMNTLKGWGSLTIVDTVIKEYYKNEKFILCPYVPDGRLVEALETVKDWKDAKIIFGHQLLNGVKMGAIVAEDVEEWLDNYPLLISGHIHDKQKIKSNLFYVGSSQQQAFGETEDKTISLINFETLDIEDIDLELSKKKIIYIESNEMEDKIKNLKIKPNEEIKIVVSGDYNFFKEFKKTEKFNKILQEKNIKKIVFKQKDINIDKNIDEKYKEIRNNDFLELLDFMVKEEDDSLLTSLYENIMYNKLDKSEINDDVLIL
jgi:DNA repair exonuclease SbcCD nuclease subunit